MSMMRALPTSALIALGLALTACGPVNRGLSSVNQPVVTRTDYVFDVRADGGGLPPGEAARVTGWFDSLALGYGDHIAIDDPAQSPAARAAVSRIAARYGLLLEPAAPVTGGAMEPGTLRIVVSRSVAEVPHCPNWERKSQPELASSTMSNHGCANNANLAAMVADPQDLIRGREGDAGTDARVAIKAVRAYRDAEPTGKAGLARGSSSVNTRGGN
jgi:pilus assembly protein CpaD